MTSTEIILDGSVLEGGGQLLRNAVALSTLLSQRISIQNIRANRRQPGLRPQHAAGLRLVAELCGGSLSGSEPGTTEIDYRPGLGVLLSRTYSADPGTAGATTLLLQVSLPCLLFSPAPSASDGPPTTELILCGGTNAIQAPQIDYTAHVFLPFIQRHFGLAPSLQVKMRGYYPKGGGRVRVVVPAVPGPLPSVNLTHRGSVEAVRGRAYVAGLPAHLAASMRNSAAAALQNGGIDPDIIHIEAIREESHDAVGSGSGIVLWAETDGGCVLGGSAIGVKGKKPAKVGEEAANELLRNLAHGGCVDEYMQDQMIIFLALAKGRSSVKTGPLTLHTKTAIWVVEQLTKVRFVVHEESESSFVIQCDGIGYTRLMPTMTS
ncbi:RNA 3'-terminal phosphate cyclase [Rhodofomes roseus]|uniref:RNA 3'-terminal-phosphate cyclase (ATP) n=1 Tax=Rhodofomes roseus TaxID=34475 RepID=A0ABQ8K2S1_9APHY|nr:RNA 3'-terminal phosphate cyclase [Rhodofomes roseus]KAH9831012.1 RNA 3'-terminal phosphate cyclase [Rhodofomes roseus]